MFSVTNGRQQAAGLLVMLATVACNRKPAPTEPDCLRAHTGSFVCVFDAGPEGTLVRSATEQSEFSADGRMVVKTRIRWIDPCTYVLFDRTTLRTFPGVPPDDPRDTMVVHLLTVDAKGYDFEAVLNGDPRRSERGRILFEAP